MGCFLGPLPSFITLFSVTLPTLFFVCETLASSASRYVQIHSKCIFMIFQYLLPSFQMNMKKKVQNGELQTRSKRYILVSIKIYRWDNIAESHNWSSKYIHNRKTYQKIANKKYFFQKNANTVWRSNLRTKQLDSNPRTGLFSSSSRPSNIVCRSSLRTEGEGLLFLSSIRLSNIVCRSTHRTGLFLSSIWPWNIVYWRVIFGTLLFILDPELGKQRIAGLLGVSQQHGGIGFEEDGVVDGRVAHAEGPLHHNHLGGRWQSPH